MRARVAALVGIGALVALSVALAQLGRLGPPAPRIHEIRAPGGAQVLLWVRPGDAWVQVVVSKTTIEADPQLWTVRAVDVGRAHALAPQGDALWIGSDGATRHLDLSVKAVDVSFLERANPATVLEVLSAQEPRLRALLGQ